MAKEYFSHDYNTRADEKIKNLIRKHGMLGYGIFWALVEDLYQNENSLSLDYDGIAYDLRVDSNTVESIVNDFGLFCLDEGFISSNSIGERINIRLEKSKTATNNALKRRTPSSVPAEKCIFYAIRIYDESEEFIKAGITTESVSRRYSGKLNGYKYSLIISHDIDLQEAINLENMVSEKCLKYSPFRKFPGFLECYNISELDKINKIAMQIKPIRNAIKEKKRKEKNIKEYEIKEKESVLMHTPNFENSNFKSSDSEIKPISQPEQKKQNEAGPETALVNPFSPEFLTGIWATWKQHRLDKKCPIKSVQSENTALKHLHKLASGSEQTAISMLEKAISNGWQGFDYAAPGTSNGISRPQTENQRIRDLVNNNTNLVPEADRYVEVPDPAGGVTMTGRLFLDEDGLIKFVKAGRIRLTVDPQSGFKPSAVYKLAPGMTIDKIYESLLIEKRKSA